MSACVQKGELDAATPRTSGAAPAGPFVRVTGLTWPLHQQQIASWLLFLTFVGTFYGLFLVGLDLAPRIAIAIVYGFFALLVLFSAATATATDPVDPYSRVGSADGVPGAMYCFKCERYVLGTSKHCTICNKCVDVFDRACVRRVWPPPPPPPPPHPAHPPPSPPLSPLLLLLLLPQSVDHCMWLNNCVGKQNIAAFYLLLVSTLLMLSLQAAVGGAFIAVFVRAGYSERVGAYFNDQASPLGVFVAVLVITALCLIAVGFVVQLIIFHAHLLRRDMTTYDFIVHRSRPNAAPNGRGGGSSCSLWMREALDPQLPPPPPGDGDASFLFCLFARARCLCGSCAAGAVAAAAQPAVDVAPGQTGLQVRHPPQGTNT